MNAPETSNELRVVAAADTGALILDKDSMASMLRVADMMASSKVTIPAHLRNSPGDCMAVVLQAMQWGMNPFSIAQKTHLSQSGALGYEAQLINAVLVASGAIQCEPEYEFIGDWSRILGKVEERKSDKGGKYYVAAWNKADEDGLGVICTAVMRSGKTRTIQVMMSQCWPRFSTQWATDPQQQISYVAVRKLARRYAPGAILGVNTPEELDEAQAPREIDITPKPEPKPEPKPAVATLEACSVEKFDKNREAWKKLVVSGKKSPADLIATITTKATLSDAQKAEIIGWAAKPADAQPAPAAPAQSTTDFDAGLDGGDSDYVPA
jgi:hypothetical protein